MLGVIFDTISVKARWERWCRWNCDLRVINARKKKAFSVLPKASPWRPNHVTICSRRHSGELLQNGQFELRKRNWYFARDPRRWRRDRHFIVTTTKTPALRWATMRAILTFSLINCEGRSQKTVSTDHNRWRESRSGMEPMLTSRLNRLTPWGRIFAIPFMCAAWSVNVHKCFMFRPLLQSPAGPVVKMWQR